VLSGLRRPVENDRWATGGSACRRLYLERQDPRQTGSRVGRRGTEERHAMPERIRPAPNGAERAKSRFIDGTSAGHLPGPCDIFEGRT
jgi:hypothetical protein